ncbi:hypothetical protein [Lysinibacillus agricola]|uniref:hypothetical protein n=1 Tax=Lysinibacillus agricola TaxID=2590012 RepID=UPI003C165C99
MRENSSSLEPLSLSLDFPSLRDFYPSRSPLFLSPLLLSVSRRLLSGVVVGLSVAPRLLSVEDSIVSVAATSIRRLETFIRRCRWSFRRFETFIRRGLHCFRRCYFYPSP